jgi:hypothetical protein
VTTKGSIFEKGASFTDRAPIAQGQSMVVDQGTGFLFLSARIAKVGEMQYFRQGRNITVEVIPAYLFSDKTLASFNRMPIVSTVEHPNIPEIFLTPETVKQYIVGSMIRAYRDKDEPDLYLTGDFVVYDSVTIAQILSGELRELSPAYKTNLIFSGIPDRYIQGDRYDVNHVAYTRLGRAGHDVSILDSVKALGSDTGKIWYHCCDSLAVDQTLGVDDMTTGNANTTAVHTVKRYGIEVVADSQNLDALEDMAKTAKDAPDMTKSMDAMSKRMGVYDSAMKKMMGVDALPEDAEALETMLTGFLAKLQAMETAVSTPASIEDIPVDSLNAYITEKVKARTTLENQVRTVTGVVSLDGLTDRQVKVMALKKVNPKYDDKDLPDTAVDSAYDFASPSFKPVKLQLPVVPPQGTKTVDSGDGSATEFGSGRQKLLDRSKK